MSQPLMTVKNLKKYFPIYSGLFRKQVGEIKAVDGIDFTIEPGKILGLVGESGSGKSTAARAAIRLVEPTAGEITYKDRNLLALSKDELKALRKDIQIIFQDPYASLNPRKTIGESIGEPLLYHQLVSSEEEKWNRVSDVLQQVGLSSEVMNRFPHEFSGGQQQRICIARALVLQPSLIVCDEAVSALDVSIQAQILNLLLELRQKLNLSYLFISHDLAIVHQIADEVLVMYKGKIVERGEAEELFNNPQDPYTIKLLKAIPKGIPKARSNLSHA